MNEKTKIALACFLGAALGTMIAWELNPWFFWVGLIVGALTGYLSYDWREVAIKAPAAYRAARGWVPGEDAKVRFWLAVGYILSIPWAIFCIWLLSLLPYKEDVSVFSWVSETAIIAFLFFMVSLLVVLDGANETLTRTEARKVAIQVIPPVTVYYALRGLIWLVPHMPRVIAVVARFCHRAILGVVRFFGRFAWKLFLALMSEARLICLLGAALGTLAGIFAGMVIRTSGATLPYGLNYHVVGALLSVACGVLGIGFGLIFRYVVVKRYLAPRGLVTLKVR